MIEELYHYSILLVLFGPKAVAAGQCATHIPLFLNVPPTNLSSSGVQSTKENFIFQNQFLLLGQPAMDSSETYCPGEYKRHLESFVQFPSYKK